MNRPLYTTPTEHLRSGRRMRTVAVGVIASVTLLGLAGVPSVASAAVSSSAPGTSRVSLADRSSVDWGSGWSNGSPWGDQGGSDGSGGYGSGSNGSGDNGGSAGPGGSSGPDGSGATSSTTATAAQSKGVVLIDTVMQYAGAQAAGTGMILTDSGQVLTNYHVVEGATKITATVASTGKTYPATVVGHDQAHDVALLQLKDASGLDTVKIDQDSVAVGDNVTAVGNAGGTGTLTAAEGQVTSLSASVTTAAEGTAASESLTGMIENDADVVAGDSGGPLYDQQGEVIGIDTAGASGGQVDSYAVPVKEALNIVDQIRSGQDNSTVQVGASAFLGVMIGSDASSQSGSMNGYLGGSDQTYDGGTSDTSGAPVSDVVPGGPAADAGIAAGDTITQVGSQTISSAGDLSGAMVGHKVGDKVQVGWVDSNGASHTATATLDASPVA